MSVDLNLTFLVPIDNSLCCLQKKSDQLVNAARNKTLTSLRLLNMYCKTLLLVKYCLKNIFFHVLTFRIYI